MKKIRYYILILFLLIGCSAKKEYLNTVKKETPAPTVTPMIKSTPTSTPTSSIPPTPIILPNLSENTKSEFGCPPNEYYGLADSSVGTGLTLVFTNDGYFKISYDGAGGDYYYGRYEQIDSNLFSYYGEVLNHSELERCQGEGCFIMPELYDTTIDGYLKLLDNKMYFIPYQINYEDLINYSDDKPCLYFSN